MTSFSARFLMLQHPVSILQNENKCQSKSMCEPMFHSRGGADTQLAATHLQRLHLPLQRHNFCIFVLLNPTM